MIVYLNIFIFTFLWYCYCPHCSIFLQLLGHTFWCGINEEKVPSFSHRHNDHNGNVSLQEPKHHSNVRQNHFKKNFSSSSSKGNSILKQLLYHFPYKKLSVQLGKGVWAQEILMQNEGHERERERSGRKM